MQKRIRFGCFTACSVSLSLGKWHEVSALHFVFAIFLLEKSREIVVNITQSLIDSNIFRCSRKAELQDDTRLDHVLTKHGWCFTINDNFPRKKQSDRISTKATSSLSLMWTVSRGWSTRDGSCQMPFHFDSQKLPQIASIFHFLPLVRTFLCLCTSHKQVFDDFLFKFQRFFCCFCFSFK